MEASALRAPAGLGRTHLSVGTPLLRLRSDEQLVALFRAGHDEAFRVIHDRYRQRLFAYARQMLSSRQDAEDALQDVFIRAYSGLRANDRQLALRAWLYRVVHNRCIDELRRPPCSPSEALDAVCSPLPDPPEEAQRRESLRRLVADVRRLPDQQRSALLMREISGMSYSELARALDVSVAAVKSLLVRARIGLVQSAEARDTACAEIRDELTLAHDRGVRPNATARRHMRDCVGCRCFRAEIRGTSRQLAAFAPALGPLGVLAKLLGIGAGGTGVGSTGAVAGGSTGALAGGASGAAAGGVLASSATHVATLLAAAVVTAGGAAEIQHTLSSPGKHRTAHHRTAGSADPGSARPGATTASAVAGAGQVSSTAAGGSAAPPGSAGTSGSTRTSPPKGYGSPLAPPTGGSPPDVAQSAPSGGTNSSSAGSAAGSSSTGGASSSTAGAGAGTGGSGQSALGGGSSGTGGSGSVTGAGGQGGSPTPAGGGSGSVAGGPARGGPGI